MPEDEPEIVDLDFASEMHHLASEAQVKASPAAARLDRKDLLLTLGQMVRPLAIELENIKRATSENSLLLTILGKAAKTPASEPEGIERISQQLQRLGAVETANQKLFDALHTELKGYKDNFLFDALQRPFIRDLVAIFDDFSAVRTQVSHRLTFAESKQNGGSAQAKPAAAADPAEDPAEQTETDFLRALAGNVDNQVHHLLEVFSRLEVSLSQSPPGTQLDKKMHRTVGFETAAGPDADGQVVRSLKPGFTWRERMIRPEEVVISRWTGASPPSPVAAPENKEDLIKTDTSASAEDRPPNAEGRSANRNDSLRRSATGPEIDQTATPPTEALL